MIAAIPSDLADVLRLVDRRHWPWPLFRCEKRIRKTGNYLSVFEVIESGAVFIYVHADPVPRPERVRAFYLANVEAVPT